MSSNERATYLLKTEIENDKLRDKVDKQSEEIERLHSIIEEAREYIKKNYPVCAGSELLEILDKVEENKWIEKKY